MSRLFVFLFLISTALAAQQDLDSFIQGIAATQQEDINYEELYESLYQLYQDPLDINTCTAEDLRSLYLLSEMQINNILDYREKTGNFIELIELQSIEGIEERDVENLMFFVRINAKLETKGILKDPTEHYLVLRTEQTLEKNRGFVEGKYLGSRQKYYTRYRAVKPGVYSFGFISEKDVGESSILDYTAFHGQIKSKGLVKDITVGNFALQTGQGLVYGAGFSAGKGAETIFGIRKSHLGVRPYNSIVESGGFMGAAVTMNVGLLDISVLASQKNKDANLLDEESFSSILTSGNHRTESELEDRKSLKEQSLGLVGHMNINRLQLGFSYLGTQFNKSYTKRDLLYNAYDFSGSTNSVFGVNYSYSWQNVNFFGEMARSKSKGNALVLGAMAALSPKVEWSFLYRDYGPSFHSFYANGFGENSRVINEKGLYSGIKFKLNSQWKLTAFYDYFKFPWLRYLVNSPSVGSDYLLRLHYRPSKTANYYVQYHSEQKQKTVDNILRNTYRTNSIANLDYAFSKNFKIQSRFQVNTYKVGTQNRSLGWAIMQDLEGKFSKITYRYRIAYFNTPNYDTRVYAYENDLLYAVSFPAYFYKGFRCYFVNKIDLNSKLNLSFRLAMTIKPNETSLGSGNDLIDKNHKTDLKIQLKYKL